MLKGTGADTPALLCCGLRGAGQARRQSRRRRFGHEARMGKTKTWNGIITRSGVVRERGNRLRHGGCNLCGTGRVFGTTTKKSQRAERPPPGGPKKKETPPCGNQEGGTIPSPTWRSAFSLACDVLLRTNMWKWASPYAGLVGYACTSANGESRISAVVLQGGSIAPPVITILTRALG